MLISSPSLKRFFASFDATVILDIIADEQLPCDVNVIRLEHPLQTVCRLFLMLLVEELLLDITRPFVSELLYLCDLNG
jgi:hypothetical protein